MAIIFDKINKLVIVEAPDTDVTCQELIDAIRDYEDEWYGIDIGPIANAYGKQDLGGGVSVGITLELINDWRLMFENRGGPTYERCTVSAGNLVAVNAYGNDPIYPSTYTTIVIAQSTSAALVAIGGAVPTVEEIADGVWDETMADHVALGSTGATLADTAFQRAVYIDAVNGNSGTTFPRGTQGDPVDNVSDAKDIAEARNSNQFRFMSDITISGENISGYFLDAVGVADVAITLGGGCTTQNTDFRDMVLGGTFSGFCTLHDVICSELTDYQGYSYDCIFIDNVTCVAGGAPNLFLYCYGGKGAVSPVEFDIGSTQTVFMGWQGGVKIVNKTGANVTQVGLNNGHVTIDSTCVAGTIIVDGIGSIVADNSGAGCTVLDSNLIPVAIWEDPIATELIANVGFIKDVEGGRWRIVSNQMIFYKSDNITEVARFNLFDADGVAAMENVYQRQRV